MKTTLLANKIALVTGASQGIGRSIALQLAKEGAHVILIARRMNLLEQLANHIHKTYSTQTYILELDVSKTENTIHTLKNLPSEWQNIDILVNNAGLAIGLDKMQDAKFSDWNTMIDTNIKGLLAVTHAILPFMLRNNKGHIVNIGSIAGREVYPGGAVYCATKHALSAISRGLKMDLLGTAIKCTNIEPGMVETEFSLVRFEGNQERAKKVYENMAALNPDDVAEAVLFAVTRPPHVNISELLLLPTDQASIHLVHRRKN